MKFVVPIVTFVLLGMAFFVFGMLLLVGLNGFSEKDADTAMGINSIWLIICPFLMAIVSFFVWKFLGKKSWSEGKAALTAIISSVVIGLILNVAVFILALVIADLTRRSRIGK